MNRCRRGDSPCLPPSSPFLQHTSDWSYLCFLSLPNYPHVFGALFPAAGADGDQKPGGKTNYKLLDIKTKKAITIKKQIKPTEHLFSASRWAEGGGGWGLVCSYEASSS
uniref:Uncharacterized protein n=1 Tax=Knipowitschia caucasica TaxID=637954 RepID=A0AAV2KCQ5_KNICA